MGRNFENRKNAIFKTAGQKSKLYSKYGKQLYVVAKNGVPDPEANPALRSLIEKAKRDQVPAHVIEKAIEKARGAGGEDFVSDADPESALDFRNNFASDVPLSQSFQCLRNRFQCNLFRNGWSDLPYLY